MKVFNHSRLFISSNTELPSSKTYLLNSVNTLQSFKSTHSPQLCIPVIGTPQSKTFKSD